MQKLEFTQKIFPYQIDFVGHVNNIIYIQWMENGRTYFLDAIGFSATDLDNNEGIVPILTDTKITYKRPYFLANEARIELWVSKMNNASALMEFRFYNEKDELCATGQQKGLFINRKTMRPSRITPEHRIAFEKYLIEE